MAIEFGDDDGTNVDSFPESQSLVETGLPDTGVHDEDDLVRLDDCLHLLHLVEELLLLLVTTRRVDDDDVETLSLEHVHALLGYLHWVSLSIGTVEGYTYFGSHLLELIEGACSESIGADEGWSPPLAFPVVSVLSSGCCLTRSLQSNEHDNILFAYDEPLGLPFLGWKGLRSDSSILVSPSTTVF
jgi:hypothetical protein